jgi:hypothetical protein
LTPFQLLYEGMIVPTFWPIASTNPGMWTAAQRGFVADGVAAIDAAAGTAVADEVLGAGDDPLAAHRRALEAADVAARQQRSAGRVFAETLVGAAPALVAHDRHARREGPLEPGAARPPWR